MASGADFIRGCLPRLITSGEPGSRQYWTRPARVSEALAITMLAEEIGELQSRTPEVELFFHILAQGTDVNNPEPWFPLPLIAYWRSGSTEAERLLHRGEAVRVALDLIHDQTKEDRAAIAKKHAAGETTGDQPPDFTHIDWSAVLGDYQHVYGCAAQDALREWWKVFLSQSAQIARQEARTDLRYIHAKSLPHIESDSKRKKAFDDLRRRAGIAGYGEQKPKPMTPEEQLAKIEGLMAPFGNAGKA